MTWQPTATTVEEWGTVGVIIDGTDVTWFRDKPVQVQQYSLSDPFTDDTAVIRLPGLTGFGTQPAWLRRLASVEVYRLNPSNVRDRWLFVGQVASVEYDTEGATIQCVGAMSGSLANRVNPQRPFRRTADIGTLVHDLWRAAPRQFTSAPDPFGTPIGITTDRRGSRSESALDYMLFLLEQSTQSNGNQYTWLRAATDKRAGYRFQLRDLTTEDWTITYGGRGIDTRLSRDYTTEVTAIYGEGVDQKARRWRNLKVPNVGPETEPDFPNDDDSPVTLGQDSDDVDNPDSMTAMVYELYSDGYLTLETFTASRDNNMLVTQAVVDAWGEVQRRAGLATSTSLNTATWSAIFAAGEGAQNLGGARFDPLYQRSETQPYLFSANGSIVGQNPDYDSTQLPVERFVAFGDGISRADAARIARREVERVDKATYRGSITLTADPQEGHRLDIMPGDNIRLKQFTSNSGVLLHVSGVSVDLTQDTMPVTLAVDNVGTMLPTLLAQFERDRQRRKDPVWRLSKSRTATSSDGIVPWDYEAGSGRIQRRSVTGGGWRVSRFLGAEAGIIQTVRIDTAPAREFAFAIFGKDPGAAWLQANVGNPLDADAGASPWQDPDLEDALNDREFVEAWGWAGDGGTPCGYGRKAKGDTGASLVGWTADSGQWSYFSDNGVWLYLAIWTSGDTEVSGTLQAQITEGE